MASAENRPVPDIQELEKLARRLRKLVLKTTHNAGCGHTGGSLSEVELLTALYFRVMRIDPAHPRLPDRDRFILSKGHATPGYYSCLAMRGYFDAGELDRFDRLGSFLQGHPDMLKTPGVDMSTGSLGQGLSCGMGMALGGAADGRSFFTYVLLGDGECQEGQVWEAAWYAGARRVKRLAAIIDDNKVQLASTVKEVTGADDPERKWRAFGWEFLSCDGHNMADVVRTLERARDLSLSGPVVVLAHTVKGKGVSFMENRWEWHGRAPNDAEFAAAMRELGEENQ